LCALVGVSIWLYSLSQSGPPSPVLSAFTGTVTALSLGNEQVCLDGTSNPPRCGLILATQVPKSQLAIGQTYRVIVVAVPANSSNYAEEFVLLKP
jgi:hypothetical protein